MRLAALLLVALLAAAAALAVERVVVHRQGAPGAAGAAAPVPMPLSGWTAEPCVGGSGGGAGGVGGTPARPPSARQGGYSILASNVSWASTD